VWRKTSNFDKEIGQVCEEWKREEIECGMMGKLNKPTWYWEDETVDKCSTKSEKHINLLESPLPSEVSIIKFFDVLKYWICVWNWLVFYFKCKKI